ncbi:leukotriene A-4 hydrolase-like isoform X2 [Achroia grisella]|uniref:leukotriene A-4 hydrolase-like isoform X2 n=1 Tax=Achroia grisella TaxID=688607 RepID=UPI0027D237BA|nr:leukotriene A-4 hydrolase-like isoform X2 [Achroia grisella]
MTFASKVVSRVIRNNLNFFAKKYQRLTVFPVIKSRYHCYSSTLKKNLHGSPFKFHNLLHSQVKAMGALSSLDPSSFSQPDLAVIKHVSLILNVDFEKKVLDGSAVVNFDVLQDIEELILDVRNITIEKIELEDGTPLRYKVDDEVPNFGSKLTITLPKSAVTGDKLKIRIKYVTAPSASALQWLEPSQTSGKKHPYLFSQCQPIHARSILPCQDTPAVKFTYDAEVTAPEEFTVLMSALRSEAKNNKTTFRQPVPIPSYLLALAVGVLEYRTLGPRSLVWSEKEEIERSAWEFAETEKYLQAAEKLCGKYEWSQYDLLVLPPSFPYGGMENPCLTFVTPTLLAGDRSQAEVIVHEIMHSWTGNLVTNNNFEHFWLNEGFTVFLERKVGASLIADTETAKRSRDFHSLLGLQELTETVKDELGITNPLTRLVVDLKAVHPDDAFSTVPYEKGSLFLRYLEDLVGGPEVFDDFLRSYLNNFQKKSLNTDQFKAYLLNYFKDNENLKTVDWNAWLYTSGMPPVIPNYDTSMTKAVKTLISVINDANATLSYNDVKTFTPHQIINLLQELIDQSALTIDRLQTLGEEYRVKNSKNSEIIYRWLRLCIRSRDLSKLNDAFEFVNQQGRMKYVRPIYRDLYAWEDVREQAIENFLKNEPYMMHVSAYTLRKDLHLKE